MLGGEGGGGGEGGRGGGGEGGEGGRGRRKLRIGERGAAHLLLPLGYLMLIFEQ